MFRYGEEVSWPNRTIGDFPPREEHEELGPGSADDKVPATAAHEELAHDLGYATVRQMMEQSEIVPLADGTFMYLTTDSDNYWVAWKDKPFTDIQRFDSRQEALASIQQRSDWVTIQN